MVQPCLEWGQPRASCSGLASPRAEALRIWRLLPPSLGPAPELNCPCGKIFFLISHWNFPQCILCHCLLSCSWALPRRAQLQAFSLQSPIRQQGHPFPSPRLHSPAALTAPLLSSSPSSPPQPHLGSPQPAWSPKPPRAGGSPARGTGQKVNLQRLSSRAEKLASRREQSPVAGRDTTTSCKQAQLSSLLALPFPSSPHLQQAQQMDTTQGQGSWGSLEGAGAC